MNNTNEYIISHLKNPANYLDKEVINWLIDKMSYEEVCSLDSALSELSETLSIGEDSVYDWDAIFSVNRRIKKLKSRYNGGNKTLASLIAELKATNSMDVADELFDRFHCVSYNEQKRILKALLDSEHRCLARQLLDDEWAKIFLTTLQRNWLKHDDTTVNKYIIKLSSEEFLFKHIDKLANEWWSPDYNLLCMRLGNNPNFVLNEKLLWQKWKYYTVMCVLGRGIEKKEILSEVFSYIKKAIVSAQDTFVEIDKSIWFDKRWVSAQHIPEVGDAIFAMRDAELNDELEFFYRWDSEIRAKLKEALNELSSQGKECEDLRDKWMLYFDIAKQNFPDYSLFRSQSNKSSEEEALGKLQSLIEEFGLELDDDPFENFPAPRLKAPYSEADIYPWYNGVPF